MLDFPSSPTTGQPVTAGGVTWVWDGVKWTTSGSAGPATPLAMNDNRIINGDMRIDQRNGGVSGTATGYTVDRWGFVGSVAGKGAWQRIAASGIALAPYGFGYALLFQSSSAYAAAAGDSFQFYQVIEADAVSDFAWGTASAQPVTLSFWFASSLSGTFGGCISNLAGTRSYPFTFAYSPAVWTKIIITIPGDTAGTWVLSGNAGSVVLHFDLGAGSTYRGTANVWASTNYVGATGAVSVVGTNGATFYITGVKLETGSVATPFNRYSLAKSMADCQRYYQFLPGIVTATGYAPVNGVYYQNNMLPVPVRTATPTIAISNVTGISNATNGTYNGVNGVRFISQGQAVAAGQSYFYADFAISAEL